MATTSEAFKKGLASGIRQVGNQFYNALVAATTTVRDAIPLNQRTNNMLVYVGDINTPNTATVYQLIVGEVSADIMDNLNWVEVKDLPNLEASGATRVVHVNATNTAPTTTANFTYTSTALSLNSTRSFGIGGTTFTMLNNNRGLSITATGSTFMTLTVGSTTHVRASTNNGGGFILGSANGFVQAFNGNLTLLVEGVKSTAIRVASDVARTAPASTAPFLVVELNYNFTAATALSDNACIAVKGTLTNNSVTKMAVIDLADLTVSGTGGAQLFNLPTTLKSTVADIPGPVTVAELKINELLTALRAQGLID
jgi:hypothetical protein